MARDVLPAAEDVQKMCVYSWRGIVAPVLRGFLLDIFVWLSRTPIFSLIYKTLSRKSGVPQALSDVTVREQPMFGAVALLEYGYRDAALCKQLTGSACVKLTKACEGSGRSTLSAASHLAAQDWRPAHSGRPCIADYHEAYKSGRTDPVKVAERILNFLQQHNGQPHVARTKPDSSSLNLRWFYDFGRGVLEAAEASKARWDAGKPLSLLDGVPYAVKDNLHVQGYSSPCGTRFLGDMETVPGDCDWVAAIRDAGAVLIGKTIMHEFGLSTLGTNAHFGVCRNPWNVDRLCGGSSSGSAGVVGSGLVPFALAADAGGSTRVPAALCGAFGFIPTAERVGEQGAKLCWTVGVAGPITSCASDAALLYALMVNKGQPAVEIPRGVPAGNSPLKGLRVGVYRDWFDDCTGDVHQLCGAALDRLQSSGARVVDICIPELELCRVAHTAIIGSEILQQFRWVWSDSRYRKQLGKDLQVAFAILSRLSAAEYIQANRIRARMHVHARAAFESCDVVLTPTTPITAPPRFKAATIGGEQNLVAVSQLMKYAQLGNLLGLPAAAVPCGVDKHKMPVSVQIMGPAWHEASVLLVARVLERSFGEGPQHWLGNRQVACDPLKGAMSVLL